MVVKSKHARAYALMIFVVHALSYLLKNISAFNGFLFKIP